MEARAFAFFNELRERHFPANRNLVPAHLSLFHQLPGEQAGQVKQILRDVCVGSARPVIAVTGIRHLGHGVAFTAQSSDLSNLHKQLALSFAEWLTPQDRQRFQPHITVQNKVPAATAKALLAVLEAQFSPWTFEGTGLSLWRYLDGPWELLETFAFADNR